jgi:tetratricopeptide (TPR) repeat protein
MRTRYALGIIFVATLCAFSPLLGPGNDFLAWDDTTNIVEQPSVNTWSRENIVAAWDASAVTLGVYEPLGVMLKLVTIELFGMQVRPFHLTTLAIHVANAWLVFWLALLLIRNCDEALQARLRPGYAGLAAALLFALNPMRVEVVAWASGQSYGLAAFFLLLSLVAYARYCEARVDPTSGRRPALLLALSVLAYAFAVLSKSAAIFLPPVLLLLDYYPFRRKLDFGLLLDKLPHGVTGTALFAIVWSTTSDKQGITSFDLDLTGRIAYAVNSLPFHLGKALWPARVHPAYGVNVSDVDPFTGPLLFCTAVAALAAGVAWALRKRAPWLSCALGVYALGILPVSGLFTHGDWLIGADRYAYMPLVGVWIVLGAAATSTWAMPVLGLGDLRSRITVAALLLVLLTWGVTTQRVTRHWGATETLWRYTLELDPANRTALNNLGYFFMSRQRYEEGLPLFSSAIRVDPGNLKPVLNLGVSLSRLGRVEEAIYVYKNALPHHPRSAAIYNNLGVAYNALGHPEKAAAHFRRSKELQSGTQP